MTPKAKKTLQIALPLLLGVGLFLLLYRRVDLEVVRQTLREEVNWWIIALTCLLGPLSALFRGLRWDLLVDRLKEEDHPTRLQSVLHVEGNYAVNMAVPRLGDIWRCSSMHRYSGIPFSRLFGTLVTERAVDLATTLFIILPGFALNAAYFTSFVRDNVRLSDRAEGLLSTPGTYIILALILLGIYLLWRLARRMKLRMKIREGWVNFLVGMRTILGMPRRDMLLFLLYSVAIWVAYFLAFYLTFAAFSFTAHLGMGAALLIFSLITITSVLPVQGNIGPWHFVVIQSLIFFGVTADAAASFALVVHTSQTLVMTLAGLIAILLLPLSRSKS